MKERIMYALFIDLEKAHYKVHRKGIWETLTHYGVLGRLLHSVKNFYDESVAYMRLYGGTVRMSGWKELWDSLHGC